MRKLAKLRRAMDALGSAHIRVRDLDAAAADSRLVTAEAHIAQAFDALASLKRDYQTAAGEGSTLRDALNAGYMAKNRKNRGRS